MICIQCGGELRVTNTYTATPVMTTARKVCRECGAVHVEERILELKSPRRGGGAYARAEQAKKARAAAQKATTPAGADG